MSDSTVGDRIPPLGWSILLDGWRLARRFLWRGILYSAVVEVATTVVLLPLVSWSFYLLLEFSGDAVPMNYELVDVFRNPRLLLALFWTPLLAWLALLGVGGLATLAAASHRGERLSLGATFRHVARCLPLVRGAAVLKVVLYFFVAMPLLAALAGAVVSGAFLSLPDSALFEIVPRTGALLAGIVLVVVIGTSITLWLTVRWCFVIFGVAVEGLALGAAFRASTRLARGNGWKLLRLIATGGLVVAVTLGAGAALLGIVNALVVQAMSGASELVFTSVAALLVTLDLVLLSTLASIGASWILAVNAKAYFQLRGDERPGTDWLGGRTSPDLARAGMKRRLLVALVLLIAASALTVPDVSRVMNSLERGVLITAHRGNAVRTPENTLAAVRAAIEDGADYIEIDVQQARDGQIILLHDLTLERTAGRPEGAWELTTDELTAIDAGSWFSEAFAGENIPTLAEVIHVVRGHCRLNIEVKLHGREQDLVRTLLDVLEEGDFTDECVITSLDRSIVAEVRRQDPTMPVGMIITASLGNVLALDVDLLVVQPLIATPAFIARAHRLGREVHVWSLNEPRNMHLVIDRGADGILTPDPALGRRVIEARTPVDDVRATLLRLFGRTGRMAPAPAGWE